MTISRADLLTLGYEKHVAPVLELNDKLRKLTHLEKDINVPTIVAVGDQSHGKSSVMEALSGVCLPRGEGMKTKLPLSLKLRSSGEDEEEYALIKLSTEPESQALRIQLSEVATQVDNITDKAVGGENICDIKDEEIDLTVFRKGQTNLDLIDLPGITRVTGDGCLDGIEERIVEMYNRYMTPKEAILLNVVAAQTDTGNCKAFEMSLKLDVDRVRTLLVLTKVDQYVDGPERLAKRILADTRQFRLDSANIFCVRNRSQAESEKQMSLEEASRAEIQFFESESNLFAAELSPVAQLGRHKLAERLATIQRNKILETLPGIIESLNSRTAGLEEELSKLPKAPKTMYECIHQFSASLESCVQRMEDSRSGEVSFTHHKCLEIEVSPGWSRSSNGWKLASTWNERSEECTILCTSKLEKKSYEISLVAEGSDWLIELKNSEYSDETNSIWGVRGVLDLSCTDASEVSIWAYISCETSGEPSTNNHYLQFCKRRDEFAKTVRENKKKSYFFSRIFFNELHSIAIQRQGDLELPGTFPSRVAASIMQQLLRDLFPIADAFATKAYVTTCKWVTEEIRSNFGNYKALCSIVQSTVARIYSQAKIELDQHMNLAVQLFEDTFVEDHYYSSIILDVQGEINKIKADSDRRLGFVDQSFLKSMDNIQAGVLNEIVRVYAFWKAICKEYSIHIIRLVKRFTYSTRIEKQIKEGVPEAVLHDIQNLMKLTSEQEMRREQLEQRVSNMRLAIQECSASLDAIESSSN